MALTDEELERYARHIVLREIGGSGQRRLKRARVLLIGAGGLGSPCLMYLAAAGVGTLGIVDDDVVSRSNLQRQVLHATDRIDRPKTESAAAAIAAINPNVEVVRHEARLDRDNAAALIEPYGIVVDGSDNFDTRYLVNETCVRLGRTLVAAAIGQWEGQLSVYRPGGPCYACVFPERPAAGLAPSCSEAGVLGALAGVMGALQAAEVVKLIVGSGEPLAGRLLLYDALWAEFRSVGLKRSRDCPVCAAAPAWAG